MPGRRGTATHAPLPNDRHATRADFARRLQRAVVLKGWNYAELAQYAQQKAPEGVRVGKDSISHYINARYLPSPQMLHILAETLGISVEDLMPPRTDFLSDSEALPPLSVEDKGDGTAWLKINQAVEWTKAVKIMAILRGEEG